eukprot:s2150_g9.t1
MRLPQVHQNLEAKRQSLSPGPQKRPAMDLQKSQTRAALHGCAAVLFMSLSSFSSRVRYQGSDLQVDMELSDGLEVFRPGLPVHVRLRLTKPDGQELTGELVLVASLNAVSYEQRPDAIRIPLTASSFDSNGAQVVEIPMAKEDTSCCEAWIHLGLEDPQASRRTWEEHQEACGCCVTYVTFNVQRKLPGETYFQGVYSAPEGKSSSACAGRAYSPSGEFLAMDSPQQDRWAGSPVPLSTSSGNNGRWSAKLRSTRKPPEPSVIQYMVTQAASMKAAGEATVSFSAAGNFWEGTMEMDLPSSMSGDLQIITMHSAANLPTLAASAKFSRPLMLPFNLSCSFSKQEVLPGEDLTVQLQATTGLAGRAFLTSLDRSAELLGPRAAVSQSSILAALQSKSDAKAATPVAGKAWRHCLRGDDLMVVAQLDDDLQVVRVAAEGGSDDAVYGESLGDNCPRPLYDGRSYELPKILVTLLSEHKNWMEVHWMEEDFGPGTKLLGVADWFQKKVGQPQKGDMLMLLDDDHAYLPHAIGDLWQRQKSLGVGYVSSFFAYFFRGIMVPQGADIVALPLDFSTLRSLQDFHRRFVLGDSAAFLVDDLWCAMFYFLCGKEVRSFREDVIARGLETIYTRTANASVEALMDLEGTARRDRAMLQCFQGLLHRLLACDPSDGICCSCGHSFYIGCPTRGRAVLLLLPMETNWTAVSGILGAIGVACGAFGAHGLKNYTSDPALLDSWKTAASYQMLHAVMVGLSASLNGKGHAPKLFSLGCLCFSGSIYGLVLLPKGHSLRKLLGPVTPLGGLKAFGGENAVMRLRGLAQEVHQADRRIDELSRWLSQGATNRCDSHLVHQATQELGKLRNLYLGCKELWYLMQARPQERAAQILCWETVPWVPSFPFTDMATPTKRKIENAPNPDGAKTIRGLDLPTFDGAGLHIGIVSARWNSVVCENLVAGAVEALKSCNVTDITTEYVAGSYEIPQAAQVMLESGKFDGIICIGCLIKGGTMHFEYISEAVTQGIMRLNLDYKRPVIYGILGCLNEEQAKERAGVDGAGHNSGKAI